MLYSRTVRNRYYVHAGREPAERLSVRDRKKGSRLTRLSTTKARDAFSDIINRVSYRGERIVLERRGKDVVALVPVEDLRLIEEIEDRMDLEEALRRLREEPETIPWKEIKARLGL